MKKNKTKHNTVLLCVFTFWVQCCDVRCDFCIKIIFGSFLLLVVCRFYLRYVRLFAQSGVQYILCCVVFCFVFLHLVYPMLPHDNFSSVYWIFTKLIYFGVITNIPFDNIYRDLCPNDPKINSILPHPQDNHVNKFGKDPIYRTKVIMWKRPCCQKFYL
jgi:hypothetical protein